jgi:uncharacterized repeat protein (TIGR02059 family)
MTERATIKISAVNTFTIAAAGSSAEVNSSVALSSAAALAGGKSVALVFTGPLDNSTASAPARYTVTVNGAPVDVSSASLTNSSPVLLGLSDTSLRAGDRVVVHYSIRDAEGSSLAGECIIVAT